jgi:hypothetical protein
MLAKVAPAYFPGDWRSHERPPHMASQSSGAN